MRLSPPAYPPGFAAYLQPLLDARLRFQETMPRDVRRVCLAVIDAFSELGRGPTAAETAERAGLPLAEAQATLARLDARDIVKYDADSGTVIALYPFSDVPCPHRVRLDGQPCLYAM